MQDILFTKVRDVKSPNRAHPTDAGIDLYIPNDFEERQLKPGESVLIPSGLKFRIPEGYMMKIDNKSGVSSKRGFIIGACIVDQNYLGEVHIHLIKVAADAKDNSPLKPGEKIAQGIIIPVNYAIPAEITINEYEKHGNTDRGEGGFGSSGTV